MGKRKRSRSHSSDNKDTSNFESASKRSRQSYNMAFKLKIVDLVKREKKSQREVARSHNMDPKQVFKGTTGFV